MSCKEKKTAALIPKACLVSIGLSHKVQQQPASQTGSVARHPESSYITTRKFENFTESQRDKAGCPGGRLSWDTFVFSS